MSPTTLLVLSMLCLLLAVVGAALIVYYGRWEHRVQVVRQVHVIKRYTR